MMISPDQIKKCQELFRKHFNEELSDEEALRRIIDLVKMVQLVYEPLLEDNLYDSKS